MSKQTTLSDLNDHLFAQLNRLSDKNLTQKKLYEETERAKLVCAVSKNIIDNAKVALEGAKFMYEKLPRSSSKHIPDQFKLNEVNNIPILEN